MKLEEWIKKYEEKTGDKHTLPDGYVQYFLPDKGYAQYAMVKEAANCLYIYETCGDADFWYSLGKMLAVNNNLKFICTICTREINAYMRFWKIKEVSMTTEENGTEEGAVRINCVDKNGDKITITPMFKREDGRIGYACTHELGDDYFV